MEKAVGEPVLDRLNAILAAAGLYVEIRLTDEQLFNAVNSLNGVEYPIFQMSDGEKSALLLAAEIMAAPAASVLIIDEPERHLHRAISAQLVNGVISDRPDCHFIVLTHDLELAGTLGCLPGRVHALMGCQWSDTAVTGWDLQPVDTGSQLPESARRAILGGRRDLLFIEGDEDSLDLRLYKLLFPQWTIATAGGCSQVIRAVAGLRSSQGHHWIHAQGVVDGDGRTAPERESLMTRGILPLPVNEVESLYYLTSVIKAVATRQAATLEKSASEIISDARERSLRVLGHSGTLERLVGKLALAAIRRTIVEQIPTTIDAANESVEVSFRSPFARMLTEVQTQHQAGDFEALVRSLPIRDTPVKAQVATALGFQSSSDYEAAARVCIKSDAALTAEVRSIVDLAQPNAGDAPSAHSA